MPAYHTSQPQLRSDEDWLAHLASYGLTMEVLQSTVHFVKEHLLMLPSAVPAVYRGSTIWGIGNAALREQLAPAGWKGVSDRNDEQAVHPEASIAVTVKSGDENTGLLGEVASQKSPAGQCITQAVLQNQQLLLPEIEAQQDAFLRLFLLIYTGSASGIRAELSIPVALSDSGKRFTHAARRIMIPLDAADDFDVLLPDAPDKPDDTFEIQLKSS